MSTRAVGRSSFSSPTVVRFFWFFPLRLACARLALRLPPCVGPSWLPPMNSGFADSCTNGPLFSRSSLCLLAVFPTDCLLGAPEDRLEASHARPFLFPALRKSHRLHFPLELLRAFPPLFPVGPPSFCSNSPRGAYVFRAPFAFARKPPPAVFWVSPVAKWQAILPVFSSVCPGGTAFRFLRPRGPLVPVGRGLSGLLRRRPPPRRKECGLFFRPRRRPPGLPWFPWAGISGLWCVMFPRAHWPFPVFPVTFSYPSGSPGKRHFLGPSPTVL